MGQNVKIEIFFWHQNLQQQELRCISSSVFTSFPWRKSWGGFHTGGVNVSAVSRGPHLDQTTKKTSIWAAAFTLHPAWFCWAQHSASPSLRHDGSSQSTLQGGVCVCVWGVFLRGGRIHVWGLCTGESKNTKKTIWSYSVDFMKRDDRRSASLRPPTQHARPPAEGHFRGRFPSGSYK